MKNVGKYTYMSFHTNLQRHNIITVGAKRSSDRSCTTEERGGVKDMKELMQPDMSIFLRFVLRTFSYIIQQFPD
jgi:hypothetical protein